MQVTITLDTSYPEDQAALQRLAGMATLEPVVASPATVALSQDIKERQQELDEAKAGLDATKAQLDAVKEQLEGEEPPKRKRRTKAEMEAARAAEAAAAAGEEPEEDEAQDTDPEQRGMDGADEEDDAPEGFDAQMLKARELASELVGVKRMPAVKAALRDVGVERVSELTEDNVAQVIAAFTAALPAKES